MRRIFPLQKGILAENLSFPRTAGRAVLAKIRLCTLLVREHIKSSDSFCPFWVTNKILKGTDFSCSSQSNKGKPILAENLYFPYSAPQRASSRVRIVFSSPFQLKKLVFFLSCFLKHSKVWGRQFRLKNGLSVLCSPESIPQSSDPCSSESI